MFSKDIIKSIKDLEKELNKNLKPIFQDVKTAMFNRVKDGYGVKNDNLAVSERVLLKPLSQAYIRERARLGLGSKSQLTLTGEMLKDISFKVSKNEVLFYLKSEFSQEKSALNRADRPFFSWTIEENQIAEDRLDAIVLAVVSKVSSQVFTIDGKGK